MKERPCSIKKIGNNIKYLTDEKRNDKTISKSWKTNVKRESNSESGLRNPQFGALGAIQAHWSVSSEASTVVMPTGTGKTETMIMTIVNEKINHTVIVVPSDLLRKQTVEKVCSFGVLREIGIVDSRSCLPNTVLMKSVPKSESELDELLNNTNIIVMTMAIASRLDKVSVKKIVDFTDLLIVDEAHHITASSWMKFKKMFSSKKILQFTATPFRNDGKKVDGKIIYNYPLHKAQEEGYFKKINFYPIIEFNEHKSDLEIAKKAIECLEKDIEEGKEHILLVRTVTIDRAQYLYQEIYEKFYSKYKPVLIVSDISTKEKRERLECLKRLDSRIVVCVDMFGEGIDIPNLKVVAIHDKYKSLPITLQFIGRFARTKPGLGNASVITNIANDNLKNSLESLYSQDSDWNSLLADMSEKAIGKEISLQELEQGFKSQFDNEINIKQINPKISMQAFQVKDQNPKWDNWKNVLQEDKCKYFFNEEKKVLILIEADESKIEWTNYRDISNLNWQLYLIYYNLEKKVVCVHSSKKGNAKAIVESIFEKNEPIRGEEIFRCLYGINRLMLATVGLNSAINGPIRYKMFAGMDVEQGISEAQRANSTKSNLFGVGYDGNGRISIGCSYKGIIWSRWIESIDYWMSWCDKTIDKILDNTIDVNNILQGVLIPKMIYKLPDSMPYRIDWPIELDLCSKSNIYLSNEIFQTPIWNTEIKILERINDNEISFIVKADLFEEEIKYIVNEEGYVFSHLSGCFFNMLQRGKEISLIRFFENNPPRIKFVNQSTLEGNYCVMLSEKMNLQFPSSCVTRRGWENLGVDISVESQGLEKRSNSIQYCVINFLKENGEYDIIFDDDNPGEIADIVAIKLGENFIDFEFYHCKFSSGQRAGSRVKDLYEVCGQAEKSVEWKCNMSSVIERMIKRESKRINEAKVSRFEKGNFEILSEIKNRLKYYPARLTIFVVQPGVDGKAITKDMHQILMASRTYLQETYGVEMKLICS